MENIVLHRNIKVECWRVVGEVAKAARRPEIVPVLLRAREQGNTNATDIAEHLLFEARSRRVVAQRLLTVAKTYGLLTPVGEAYALTENGEEAARSEQVFVPEHGTWTLHASDDPLLEFAVLSAKPWSEPTALEDLKGGDRDAANNRLFENLPRWVRDLFGQSGTPVTGGCATIRIDRLEGKGEVADPESQLTASWNVTVRHLRIEGRLCDAAISSAPQAPAVALDEVWRQLLDSQGLWPSWDGQIRALRVGFDGTTPAERETMLRDLAIRRPEVEGLGLFKPTTVRGVAIAARSAEDATRWAGWRLHERICDYATRQRFAAWSAEAADPFEEFKPSVTDRRELAMAAWAGRGDRPTPRTWFLVAAEDWEL